MKVSEVDVTISGEIMAIHNLLSTGAIPPGCPIPVDLDHCFDGGARIKHNTGRCFPCRLGVKLRAAAAAMTKVQRAIEGCVNCAQAFGVLGPSDGRLCQECAEVW